MKGEKKDSKKDILRVVMFPLGSASSNVYNFLFMSFFMVFCTEALALNPMVVGFTMTAMRAFDGITDPIIGGIIDRTETKFGKFRPFLILGSFIMLVSSVLIYIGSFSIPQEWRLIWILACYSIWVIGYTCMTTVNKCALSIVTKNPTYRPISGIAGGCYSTMLQFIMLSGVVPLLGKFGGLGSKEGWMAIIIASAVLHTILLIGGLIAISKTDKPEYYANLGTKKKEKIAPKDYIEILKVNKPLRMLIVAASTDKIAGTIASGSMMYFYMYAVQNVDLQPIVSGFSTPVSLVGAFVAGSIAIRFGCKNASLIGAVANFAIAIILIALRPFDSSMTVLFIVLMATNLLFRRFSAQNIDPMIAEIIDYHKYKTGKFIPGLIGATFSFVDKLISALGSSIVGVLMGLAGYTAGAEPTALLYWVTLGMYLGAPMLGDLASIIALKNYKISKEDYEAMYNKEEVAN
ncbi:MAG: MFS transporter [Peptostreptococcaceae bacterium]